MPEPVTPKTDTADARRRDPDARDALLRDRRLAAALRANLRRRKAANATSADPPAPLPPQSDG